jgi:hypothetical protein
MHIQIVSDLESASKPSFVQCSVSAHGIPPYVWRCHLVGRGACSIAQRNFNSRHSALVPLSWHQVPPAHSFLKWPSPDEPLYASVSNPCTRPIHSARHVTASVNLTPHIRLPAAALRTQAVFVCCFGTPFPRGRRPTAFRPFFSERQFSSDLESCAGIRRFHRATRRPRFSGSAKMALSFGPGP